MEEAYREVSASVNQAADCLFPPFDGWVATLVVNSSSDSYQELGQKKRKRRHIERPLPV